LISKYKDIFVSLYKFFDMVQIALEPIQLPHLTGHDLIEEFTFNLNRYSWTDLFKVLEHDISPIVKVIVRAAIHSKEREMPFTLTIERALSRVNQIQNTKRKNFVRRLKAMIIIPPVFR
jgi:hypothetical protein